jgi:L-ascorbate metabolism protein UlaG (beta-lactamase superfamily)
MPKSHAPAAIMSAVAPAIGAIMTPSALQSWRSRGSPSDALHAVHQAAPWDVRASPAVIAFHRIGIVNPAEETSIMQITWYGHSAFRLDFAGKAVLIDPFFTGNPAFVSDKAVAIKGITHILLTHGHGDHVGDTLDIAATSGAPVVANFELCMWLAGKGLAKFDPMNTGGTTDQGGFTVTLVRADHSSGDITNGTSVYLGNPCGVIVKAAGEPTVYHMGDTDIFSDMGLIAEIHEPKVAMVPVGDRFTMGGATAALAIKRYFKLDKAIPCHYGTFPIIDPTADKFVAAMKGSATTVLVPEKGKPVTV